MAVFLPFPASEIGTPRTRSALPCSVRNTMICSTAETLEINARPPAAGLNGHHDGSHTRGNRASASSFDGNCRIACNKGRSQSQCVPGEWKRSVEMVLILHSFFPPNVVHCQTLARRQYCPYWYLKRETVICWDSLSSSFPPSSVL